MNKPWLPWLLLCAALVAGPLAAVAALAPDNSGLVLPYRGRLERDGQPVNGTTDFSVQVFTSEGSLTPCFGPVALQSTVAAGEFSLVVGPLPPACINGTTDGLWLQVSVKTSADPSPVVLNQRQRIMPTVFAMSSAPSSLFTVLGNLRVGTGSGAAALSVEKAWGTQANPLEGLAALSNTSNAAGAHASLVLRTAGSGAGDPHVSFDVAGETGWTAGMDNTDNAFKLTPAWDVVGGATTAFSVTQAGDATVRGNLDVGGALLADYDSGWVNAPGNNDTNLNHNLGAPPSSMQIWWRRDSNAQWMNQVSFYDEGAFGTNGPTVGVSSNQVRFRVRSRPYSYFHYDGAGTYREEALAGTVGQYRFLLWR